MVQEWGPWRTNQITGITARRRIVKVMEMNGGKPCPRLFETKRSKPIAICLTSHSHTVA